MASGLMIAKVLSIATKIPSEVLKCSRQDASTPKNDGRKPAAAGRAEARPYIKAPLLQGGGEGRAEVRGSFDGSDSGGGHRGVFVLGGALAAADDGAGVAHAASRRSGLAGDEADDGLLHVDLDPLRGALFGVAADFADQNDGVRVRIIVEKLDGIEERCADDGIAADADAGGLADGELRQLMDGFVGERAAAADDADISLLVDAAGHDADFALAGRDDAWAVRTDQAS